MTEKENSPLGRAWRSHLVGRDDTAIEEFRKLVAAAPDDIDALYGLGMALRSAGQGREARETFDKVLELLSKQEASGADDANRIQMLRRMVQQQITLIKN